MAPDGPNDLDGARRHDVDLTALSFVLVDEEQCLGIHEGLCDLLERLLHELLDLRPVPSGCQLHELVPGAFELAFIGSEQHVEDLGEPELHEGSSPHEAGLVERLAERERRRLRDDGLVEIEECSGVRHHLDSMADRCEHRTRSRNRLNLPTQGASVEHGTWEFECGECALRALSTRCAST